MSTEVTLPTLGESVTEGTVSRWLKAVGDVVTTDEPLLEISTDKVDTEIPAPVGGVLLEIRVREDETARVGDVLGVIGTSEPEPASEFEPTHPLRTGTMKPSDPVVQRASSIEHPWQPTVPTPPAPAAEPFPPAPEAALPGWGEATGQPLNPPAEPTEPAPAPDIMRFTPTTVAAPTVPPVEPSLTPAPEVASPTPVPVAEPASGTEPAVALSPNTAETPYITPLVRKLAAEAGIDLATLKGTGVGGRIRKQDVQAAIDAQRTPRSGGAPSWPNHLDPRRGTTETLSTAQVSVANRITKSMQVSSHLAATIRVDLSAVLDHSEDHLAFIIAAVGTVLQHNAALNATLDASSASVVFPSTENVGISVPTERGTFIPVIRNAGDTSVTIIDQQLTDLAHRANSGLLSPDELTGGTFTIIEYGRLGTLFDTPVINQPQSSALGIGSIEPTPVAVETAAGMEVAVRQCAYFSLTYDHRIIDPHQAGRFLAELKARLESMD